MTEKDNCRIDVEAAQALIYWKSLFADEVVLRAKKLAAQSNQPEHVTLRHYREAAQSAINELSAAIQDGGASSDDHKVA